MPFPSQKSIWSCIYNKAARKQPRKITRKEEINLLTSARFGVPGNVAYWTLLAEVNPLVDILPVSGSFCLLVCRCAVWNDNADGVDIFSDGRYCDEHLPQKGFREASSGLRAQGVARQGETQGVIGRQGEQRLRESRDRDENARDWNWQSVQSQRSGEFDQSEPL